MRLTLLSQKWLLKGVSYSTIELSLNEASAMHDPFSFSLSQMQAGQCLAYPQHFAALVYCRYLYATHLQLTTPLSTCEAPYFLSSCSPPPTNPMSVLLLLVFVRTCILLISFPNPGLGCRAAEKPDPLHSSPPLTISLSLSLIAGLCGRCNGKVKRKSAD